jgi:hypothetical protein
MPSLVDIFNPSFFMFLGILVLVAALLVVYFESKMREQNHKMASMLNLVTCMAEEMNAIKVHLNSQPIIGGTQNNPSSLETNNVHIIKTDLIPVSDDDDDDSDNDSENSIEDNETDSGSDSGSESNSEDIKEVIEIGGEVNDIKVLKLNLSITNNTNNTNNINDIDENNFDDLDELCGEDICISDDSISISSEDDDIEQKNDDEIDISKLNLKSINISNLEEIKSSDIIDYKKLTLSKLRSIVIEKELVADSSKLKKNELLKLLGVE